MELTIGKITELSANQIVTIFKERVAIFVVEQNCPYQEIDDEDQVASHLAFWEKGELQAYCRVIDRGRYVTFGRVIVTEKARGQQLGRKIVRAALAEIAKNHPNQLVQISAQAHLESFYSSCGFKACSEGYLEDNIPHIDMRLIQSKSLNQTK